MFTRCSFPVLKLHPPQSRSLCVVRTCDFSVVYFPSSQPGRYFKGKPQMLLASPRFAFLLALAGTLLLGKLSPLFSGNARLRTPNCICYCIPLSARFGAFYTVVLLLDITCERFPRVLAVNDEYRM